MKNPAIVVVSKGEAEKLTQKVMAQWKLMETSWWALGQLVDECLKKRVPAALGMNAKVWMEKCIPGSTSKAFRALRITRALKDIPEKQLRQITEGNAFALTKLPEKTRNSKEWVKKAAELPNVEFQEQVVSHIEKKTGIPRETFIMLHQQMPESVFEQWEAAVVKVAKILSLDIEHNPGQRITAYEAIAVLVNQTDEEILRGEFIGSHQERKTEGK